MQKITKVIIEGRAFYVLKDERGYWGVDARCIKQGKLTRPLNEKKDIFDSSLAGCINALEIQVKVEILMEETGMSREAAAMEVIFG